MMQFAAPLYLWGLLALAAPLIIHWLAQKKQRAEAFAALKLVPLSDEQASAWERWRDRILLLLRLLMLAALMAALAQPQWRRSVARTQILDARFALPEGAGRPALQLCPDGVLQKENCALQGPDSEGLWTALTQLGEQQADLKTLILHLPSNALVLDTDRPQLPFTIEWHAGPPSDENVYAPPRWRLHAVPEFFRAALDAPEWALSGDAGQRPVFEQGGDSAAEALISFDPANTTAAVLWWPTDTREDPRSVATMRAENSADAHPWQPVIVRDTVLHARRVGAQLHIQVPGSSPLESPQRWRAVWALTHESLPQRAAQALRGSVEDARTPPPDPAHAAFGEQRWPLQTALLLLALVCWALERRISGAAR